MARYLKLEFTQLTQEAYPLWESGIEVKYLSFPLYVRETSKRIQTSVSAKTATTKKTLNSTTKKTSTADPASLKGYVGPNKNTDVQLPQNVTITVGSAVVDTVPHSFDLPPQTNM